MGWAGVAWRGAREVLRQRRWVAAPQGSVIRHRTVILQRFEHHAEGLGAGAHALPHGVRREVRRTGGQRRKGDKAEDLAAHRVFTDRSEAGSCPHRPARACGARGVRGAANLEGAQPRVALKHDPRALPNDQSAVRALQGLSTWRIASRHLRAGTAISHVRGSLTRRERNMCGRCSTRGEGSALCGSGQWTPHRHRHRCPVEISE